MAARRNSLGLLVVGHGTLNRQGQQEFWTTMQQIAEALPQTHVVGCFLEAAVPNIPTALEAMAERGLTDVVLVPLLLFSAGHAERDIPAAVAAVAARTGQHVRQTEVLDCHPRVLALSALRFDQALGRRCPPQDVAWLFVGRGSAEPGLRAAVDRFVAQRRRLTPVGHSAVAFLARAQPRLEVVVPQMAELAFPVVVVQPHLLYPGTLLSRLQQLVAEQDGHRHRQQWIMAGCLGCDPAIGQVVVERYCEAAAAAGVPVPGHSHPCRPLSSPPPVAHDVSRK